MGCTWNCSGDEQGSNGMGQGEGKTENGDGRTENLKIYRFENLKISSVIIFCGFHAFPFHYQWVVKFSILNIFIIVQRFRPRRGQT